jgi:hypothetical protein
MEILNLLDEILLKYKIKLMETIYILTFFNECIDSNEDGYLLY